MDSRNEMSQCGENIISGRNFTHCLWTFVAAIIWRKSPQGIKDLFKCLPFYYNLSFTILRECLHNVPQLKNEHFLSEPWGSRWRLWRQTVYSKGGLHHTNKTVKTSISTCFESDQDESMETLKMVHTKQQRGLWYLSYLHLDMSWMAAYGEIQII